MKFGKVLTYKDIDEAKKLIGKEVIYSDYLGVIESDGCRPGDTLLAVREDSTEPFLVETARYHADREDKAYQFIREILSDEPEGPQYKPYDLSDPKVRDSLRGRWFRDVQEDEDTPERMVTSFECNEDGDEWCVNGIYTASTFLRDCVWLDDGTPCGRLKNMEVR